MQKVETTTSSKNSTDIVLGEVLSKEKAIQLIKSMLPHFEHRVIEIDHIGNYDKNGCRHTGAIGVINFNKTDQITIWQEGIKYYDYRGRADERTTGNVFDAYRLLKLWGIVN